MNKNNKIISICFTLLYLFSIIALPYNTSAFSAILSIFILLIFLVYIFLPNKKSILVINFFSVYFLMYLFTFFYSFSSFILSIYGIVIITSFKIIDPKRIEILSEKNLSLQAKTDDQLLLKVLQLQLSSFDINMSQNNFEYWYRKYIEYNCLIEGDFENQMTKRTLINFLHTTINILFNKDFVKQRKLRDQINILAKSDVNQTRELYYNLQKQILDSLNLEVGNTSEVPSNNKVPLVVDKNIQNEILSFYKAQFRSIYHELLDNYFKHIQMLPDKEFEIRVYKHCLKIIDTWYLEVDLKQYQFEKVLPEVTINTVNDLPEKIDQGSPTKSKEIKINIKPTTTNNPKQNTLSILQNIIRISLISAVILSYFSSYLFVYELIQVRPFLGVLLINCITLTYLVVGHIMFKKNKLFNARIFTSIGLGMFNVLNIILVLSGFMNIFSFLILMSFINVGINYLNKFYNNNYYLYVNFISPIISIIISKYYFENIFIILTIIYIAFCITIFKKYKLDQKFSPILFLLPLYILTAFIDFYIIKILLLLYLYYSSNVLNPKYGLTYFSLYFLGFVTIQTAYPILLFSYLIPLYHNKTYKKYFIFTMFILLAIHSHNIEYFHIVLLTFNIVVFLYHYKQEVYKYLLIFVSVVISLTAPDLLILINYFITFTLVINYFSKQLINSLIPLIIFTLTVFQLKEYELLVMAIITFSICFNIIRPKFKATLFLLMIIQTFIFSTLPVILVISYLSLILIQGTYIHFSYSYKDSFIFQIVSLLFFALLTIFYNESYLYLIVSLIIMVLSIKKPFAPILQICLSILAFLVSSFIAMNSFTNLIYVTTLLSLIMYFKVNNYYFGYITYGFLFLGSLLHYNFEYLSYLCLLILTINFYFKQKQLFFISLNLFLMITLLFSREYLVLLLALSIVAYPLRFSDINRIVKFTSVLLLLATFICIPNLLTLGLIYVHSYKLPQRILRLILPLVTVLTMCFSVNYVFLSLVVISLTCYRFKYFSDFTYFLNLFFIYGILTQNTVFITLILLLQIAINFKTTMNNLQLLLTTFISFTLVLLFDIDLLVIITLFSSIYFTSSSAWFILTCLLVLLGILTFNTYSLALSTILGSFLALKSKSNYSYSILGFLLVFNIFSELTTATLLTLNFIIVIALKRVTLPKYLNELLLLSSVTLITNYTGYLLIGYLPFLFAFNRRRIAYCLTILSLFTFNHDLIIISFFILILTNLKRVLELQLILLISIILGLFLNIHYIFTLLHLVSIFGILVHKFKFLKLEYDNNLMHGIFISLFIYFSVLYSFNVSVILLLLFLLVLNTSFLTIRYIFIVLSLFIASPIIYYLTGYLLGIINFHKIKMNNKIHLVAKLVYTYLVFTLFITRIFDYFFILSVVLILIASLALIKAAKDNLKFDIIFHSIVLFGSLLKICFFDLRIQNTLHPAFTFLILSIFLIIISNILKKLLS